MAGSGTVEPLFLLSLVEPARWQRLQDHFAGVLGIPLRTLSPSRELLVNPSWPPGLPVEQIVSVLRVGEELEQLLPLAELPRNTASLTSPFGVTYSAVPIRATPEQILGYFVAGPMVAGPREDRAHFRQRIHGLGADAQAAWTILLSFKPHTYSGIRSLLNLLEEVGSSLVQFAYQASQLSAILPPAYKADQAVVSYYTDRILTSLLEVAAMATGAEGGSVMVREGQGDLLRIRAAQGLSESVVAGTRQPQDEGLAGVATRQRSILLVDDATDDPFLKRFMRRKELVSSLVAPLTLEPDQEPVGVLSLRTSNPERRFTPEHIEMLRRLLDLTAIALGNLRAAFTKPRSS
jgi:putative methionine-R-sulfoxide reductase with GAF domain